MTINAKIKVISLLILIIHLSNTFAQNNVPKKKLKAGEHINENLKTQLIDGRTKMSHFAENHFYYGEYFVFYRYNLRDGQSDNTDSIKRMENILQRLESKVKTKQNSNFISSEEFSKTYNVLFVYFFDRGKEANGQLLSSFKKRQSFFFDCITDTTSHPHSFTMADKIIYIDKSFKIINMWPSITAFEKSLYADDSKKVKN